MTCTAQVIGHCAETTGIAPFTELVEKVKTSNPNASARRVFWIVDNGSSHRGWTAAARLSDAFPNARMIHPPVHASWLNHRDLLLRRPTQTTHPGRLRRPRQPRRKDQRVRASVQQRSTPLDWRFGRADLHRLIERIQA